MKPHTGGASSGGKRRPRTSQLCSNFGCSLDQLHGSFAAQPWMLQEIFGLGTHRHLTESRLR